MKWVTDRTGRFIQRPFYNQDELDSQCEDILLTFLTEKYGTVTYPISTNDLTIIIEQRTCNLDLYADLSMEGVDVEGVTDFLKKSKPRVRISQYLDSATRENRLRTTLTHELGHVVYHDFLWALGELRMSEPRDNPSPRCKRQTILNAGKVDWMEWQAGYASGAFLIPITPVKQLVRGITGVVVPSSPIPLTSSLGQRLVQTTVETFQVSAEAAQVRLFQLLILEDSLRS